MACRSKHGKVIKHRKGWLFDKVHEIYDIKITVDISLTAIYVSAPTHTHAYIFTHTTTMALLTADSKLPYVVITVGLTFIVAALIFFMISAGLPHVTWLVLGGLCLALGATLASLGVALCVYLMQTGGQLLTFSSQKEETVAFTVDTSDDSCVV